MKRMVRNNAVGMLVVASAGWMVACDETSGACAYDNLDPAGELYNLRIYNCVEEEGLVYVNGRYAGNIPRYDSASGTCTPKDFGTFPQCEGGKIEISTATSESMAVIWNADTVVNSGENCYTVFSYGADINDEEYTAGAIEPVLYESDLCDMASMTGLQ